MIPDSIRNLAEMLCMTAINESQTINRKLQAAVIKIEDLNDTKATGEFLAHLENGVWQDACPLTSMRFAFDEIGTTLSTLRQKAFDNVTYRALVNDDTLNCQVRRMAISLVFRHFSEAFSSNAYNKTMLQFAETTSLPNQKAATMSSVTIKIENKTFVNGADATKMTEDQLFDTIAAAEAEIRRLESLINKPKKIEARIAELQAGIAALVALSDANP